jgi:hypothetical protein
MTTKAMCRSAGPGAQGAVGRAERSGGEVMTAGQPAELTTMPTGQRLERVLGVALLAGAVSSTSLARLIGRSALDLPLADGGPTVAGQWIGAAGTLAAAGGASSVWVLVDDASPAPAAEVDGLEVLRDRGGLRGAGGALRDLAADLDPEGQILVVTGAHALLEPLAPIVQILSDAGADIAMLGEGVHREKGRPGSPLLASCSMMLASCAALRRMRPVGFVDLKEQGLSELRARHDIRVVAQAQQASAPLRTREEYIGALRTLALRAAGLPDDNADPLAERWRPTFSIAAAGAQVGAGARLCDSVALAGASVGAGATVVRSVIAGPVSPGATLVDAVVGPTGEAS